jgi:hypothetical protein
MSENQSLWVGWKYGFEGGKCIKDFFKTNLTQSIVKEILAKFKN